MKHWQELLDTFMLGTRDIVATAQTDDSISSEQMLLKQLALTGTFRRAGYTAKSSKTPLKLDPAPPETLPACSIKAIDWLQRVAGSAYTRELALDWFLFMRKHGKRVPHTALPYVLTLAAQHKTWAPYIVPVLGERGRWMVSRSTSYAALQQPELWQASEHAALKAAEIDPENKMLTELHTQMMEGLAHE